jgi:hypothetical protein
MLHARRPDRNKIVNWDRNKVSWLIYHFLVGEIIAVYALWLEEFFIAAPSPIWLKVTLTTSVFPACCAAGSVWLYKKGWLR